MIRPGDEFARPTQRALRDTMWELWGVIRSADRLERALDEIVTIRATADRLDVRPSSEGYADLAHAFDLRASLICAEATVKGRARRETRGCHVRADFPELDPRLRVNLIARLEQDGAAPDGWSVSLSSAPVAPVPDELAPWLDGEELAVAGHLLEVAACLSGRFCRSAGRRAVRVDAGCDGRPTVSRHERDDVCAARGRRS